MTRDDIIRMAKEAGLIHYHDSDGQWSGVTNDQLIDPEKNQWDDKLVEILAPFAALVAAAEREECAKVVGRYFTTARFDSRHLCLGDIRLTIGDQEEIDAAIRARSET